MQPLRLSPIKNRLGDVRREAGQWKETADVGVGHALLPCEVGNRLRAAALDPTPPAVRFQDLVPASAAPSRLPA
jgi:hypothetical protein